MLLHGHVLPSPLLAQGMPASCPGGHSCRRRTAEADGLPTCTIGAAGPPAAAPQLTSLRHQTAA